MPHIVKYKERLELGAIKTDAIWSEDLLQKYTFGPSISSNVYETKGRNLNLTLFTLIEDIIERTLPEALDKKWFNEFVDIKEVPYGKCNTDTDYRGS